MSNQPNLIEERTTIIIDTKSIDSSRKISLDNVLPPKE